MKVRIGNDIRLFIKLLGKQSVDPISINSIKAYIINTTAEAKLLAELNNKTRFISRFPIEPMIDAYTATQYNINSTGYPSYHAFPLNHVIGSYAGFGVTPQWNNIYRPIHKHSLTEYLAQVKATETSDIVEVFFPAEAQLLTGNYKIVVVAKIYEPGFSPNNLRTVTMDYENIFTLVNTSEEGVDSAVTLNVGNTDQSVNLSGETNILPGKTYTITADTSEGVRWYCKDPNVKFLEQFNNTVVYKVIEIPTEHEGMEFQIFALSKYNDNVVGKLDISVHNNPVALTVTNDKPNDYSDFVYNDTIKYMPAIQFENGEIRSYTFVDGVKVPAINVTVVPNESGTHLTTTFVNNIVAAELQNTNITNNPVNVVISFSPVFQSSDNVLINLYSITALPANTFIGDIHAESGEFENGNVTVNLNDGNSFNIDMSSETVWHEGN